MEDQIAVTVGMQMPLDFPTGLYNDLCAGKAYVEGPDTLKSAWNGVAYRFLAMDEHDRNFALSVRLHTNAPAQPHRYQQERDLFGFLVNGQSSIECFCFGAFAMGSVLMPEAFPLNSPSDERSVTPTFTSTRFDSYFAAAPFTEALRGIVGSPEYVEWTQLRNVLTHRGVPPRDFFRGGDRDGDALGVRGIAINEGTTSSRREWLQSALSDLFMVTSEFSRTHLP